MISQEIILQMTLNIVTASAIPALPYCDNILLILKGHNHVITSPQWPERYNGDQVCRWIFTCPTGHHCHLRCNFVSLPVAHKCSIDKLLVSTVGDMQLYGAETYCGRPKIDVKSVGSRMTMALVAGFLSPGGKFKCTVTADEYID